MSWLTQLLPEGADSALKVRHDWLLAARHEQLPWRIDHDAASITVDGAHTLLVMGGRGAGKTRVGAEFVHAAVHGLPPFWQVKPARSVALVGATFGDVREVMVEGPSGIMSLYPDGSQRGGRPELEISRRRLVWPNGAVARLYSADEPDGLRGSQFDAAWCDEAGKWGNAMETFDTLQFALRLGEQPRQIITTTPRPTPLIKRLTNDEDVAKMNLPSRRNAANLAPSFLAGIEKVYGGTRLGRQELDGELVEDREGALWTRDQLEKCFIAERPQLLRVVVAVDPPAGGRRTSDACGIVAAGLDIEGRVVVLADRTIQGARPEVWAARAVALYREFNAHCLLVEVNQGGDMAMAVIRAVDPGAPLKRAWASRSKWIRAEPVSMAYTNDQVRHAGRFPELEDEMCDFTKNGLSNNRSPDRLDALVWAVSELLPGLGDEPRIRAL